MNIRSSKKTIATMAAQPRATASQITRVATQNVMINSTAFITDNRTSVITTWAARRCSVGNGDCDVAIVGRDWIRCHR